MTLKTMDFIYALIPTVVGFSTSAICRIGKDAGKLVKFRPPAAAFGVIWTFLFIMFGISWAIAARSCETHSALCIIVYSLATFMLGFWIVIYGCGKSKLGACWVLVAGLATILACFAVGNSISKLLVAPLAAWAIFALIMNTTEVQEESK